MLGRIRHERSNTQRLKEAIFEIEVADFGEVHNFFRRAWQ